MKMGRKSTGGRILAGALSLAVLIVVPGGAVAWREVSYHRMVRDTVGFLPPALRGMMRLYVGDLARGVEEADEFARAAFASDSGGVADAAATIEREMLEAVRMIEGHRPFGEVFYRLGRLVGPVAELSDPLNYGEAADWRLPGVRLGFHRLGEVANPKFRILWQGYRMDLMRKLPPSQYLLEGSRRARDLYPVLYEAFVVDGKVLPASAFDFRSVPFGVASISYSRAINILANVWCAVWREAGGDMSGLPY